MLQIPCYYSVRPSSHVSEQNAQFGVRDWHLEFISCTYGDDIDLMLEAVELHFEDRSVDSSESWLVILIGEILLMQQIDCDCREGHYSGFGHNNSEKNNRDLPAKNPLKPFQGTPIMFEKYHFPLNHDCCSQLRLSHTAMKKRILASMLPIRWV
jgi:hypothetical protein